MTGKGLKYAKNKDEQYMITETTAIDTLTIYAQKSSKLQKLIQSFKIFLEYSNYTLLINQDSSQESFIFWKKVLEGSPF